VTTTVSPYSIKKNFKSLNTENAFSPAFETKTTAYGMSHSPPLRPLLSLLHEQYAKAAMPSSASNSPRPSSSTTYMDAAVDLPLPLGEVPFTMVTS
jgi:hypothetical protein